MSPPARRPLTLRPGLASRVTFAYRDLNGGAIPLTGYGARVTIRGGKYDVTPLLSLGVGTGITFGTGPTANQLTVIVTAVQVAAIAAVTESGLWDVYLDPSGTPDDTSFLLLGGDVCVRRD